MNATIQEHQFSLRSQYDIDSPKADYTAQKALLSLLDKVEVRAADGTVVATLHGNFSLFRASYEFDFADGRHFHYQCEKIWKGVYSCVGAQESYHLFQHKGVQYSIFQEDTQIAAITRNRFIVGTGHAYEIRMNADADFLVMACMILALNTAKEDSSDEQSRFTYEFGNFGPEDRRFDESWEPR